MHCSECVGSAAELLLCVEPAARSELSAILKAPRQSTLGTLFIVFAWSHPKNVFIFCLSLKFYVNTVCETYTGLFFCVKYSICCLKNKMWLQSHYHPVHGAAEEGGLCCCCVLHVFCICGGDV